MRHASHRHIAKIVCQQHAILGKCVEELANASVAPDIDIYRFPGRHHLRGAGLIFEYTQHARRAFIQRDSPTVIRNLGAALHHLADAYVHVGGSDLDHDSVERDLSRALPRATYSPNVATRDGFRTLDTHLQTVVARCQIPGWARWNAVAAVQNCLDAVAHVCTAVLLEPIHEALERDLTALADEHDARLGALVASSQASIARIEREPFYGLAAWVRRRSRLAKAAAEFFRQEASLYRELNRMYVSVKDSHVGEAETPEDEPGGDPAPPERVPAAQMDMSAIAKLLAPAGDLTPAERVPAIQGLLDLGRLGDEPLKLNLTPAERVPAIQGAKGRGQREEAGRPYSHVADHRPVAPGTHYGNRWFVAGPGEKRLRRLLCGQNRARRIGWLATWVSNWYVNAIKGWRSGPPDM